MKTSKKDSHDNQTPPFLLTELKDLPANKCLFHVIPAPYEASVSYGQGTAHGPAAILHASQQLEMFNGKNEPHTAGIKTHPQIDCSGAPEIVLDRINHAVQKNLGGKKLPVLLGGEHTVTLGAIQALKAKSPDFGIVQFDAHADLRDSYEDSPYSHACVMKRILELHIPVCQIGVRALSSEDMETRKSNKDTIIHWDADHLARHGIPRQLLPSHFPENIYITFDIDALDPSIMPATGTPEPGGLSWWQAMELLETSTHGRKLLGFDVVELAPIPGIHAPDFTAARLVLNMMGLADFY
ncbi:MAG: agmatinase [Verrucomicrobia bacterium]|nr:agmatinase [Verrucomicrobiota bacterium]MCF7707789.1 agmatinase [Verrucomicrobiota bacterium]